jgi:hypothetical protein
MRLPDYDLDGWELEDGEQYHREAPDTFWIPPLDSRQMLQPGDFAKLIFGIALDDPETPEAVERMWVLIRERTPTGYMGVLNNDPDCIGENDIFWSGAELPFEPRHIINVEARDIDSLKLAAEPPRIPWNK